MKLTYKKKLILAGICGGISALILITIVSLIVNYKRVVVKPNQPVSILPTATPTPDPDRDFTVALLGYAGGDHDGAGLTDSIMAITVQPRKKRIVMISIPRDLWVKLPLSTIEGEDFWYKINAAYVLGKDDEKYPNKAIQFTGKAGGGMVAKSVISEVLGIPVDYFVAIDFTGFTSAVNNLGGIKVKVSKSFEDPYYPITGMEKDTCGKSTEEITAIEATMSGWKLEQMYNCRYESLKFTKGVVEMNGELALKYARSRHSPTDGGDFNRARRQREVIEAVKDKVISVGFLPKIMPLINQLSYHVQTDMDFGQMNIFLERFGEFSDYEIVQEALTTENVLMDGKSSSGQFVLLPRLGEGNWEEVKQFVKKILNDIEDTIKED